MILVREGIASMLDQDPRLLVVGQAGDGLQGLEMVARSRPDVVLMDVNMPGMNGIEATRQLRRRWPDVRVIGLSVQDDPATLKAMRDAGADACLSKSDDCGLLLDSILAPCLED
jgi:DNA-binding NarL/FixJ family response regulator